MLDDITVQYEITFTLRSDSTNDVSNGKICSKNTLPVGVLPNIFNYFNMNLNGLIGWLDDDPNKSSFKTL